MRDDYQRPASENVYRLLQLPKIDGHTHLGWHCRGEALYRLLDSVNFRWITICYGGTRWQNLQLMIDTAGRMHRDYPDRFSWVTSFNLDNWGSGRWEQDTLDLLQRSFEAGAVGVKVWKEIGMALKDADSSYVMVDDDRFAPLFETLREHGRTLVAHIGEPLSCWLPLDQIHVPGDLAYYSAHPAEHCHCRKDVPFHQCHIQAMDRVLARYPGLRVVWCHLASLETDLEQISARLERYPNLAVDLAARVGHLQFQDSGLVREFFLRHQDRIIYGTDTELEAAEPGAAEDELRAAREVYIQDLIYFATDWEISVNGRHRGLALPDEVLEKIFRTNAEKWYSPD